MLIYTELFLPPPVCKNVLRKSELKNFEIIKTIYIFAENQVNNLNRNAYEKDFYSISFNVQSWCHGTGIHSTRSRGREMELL